MMIYQNGTYELRSPWDMLCWVWLLCYRDVAGTSWRLKSPSTRLLISPKACSGKQHGNLHKSALLAFRTWNRPVTSRFPTQRVSIVETFSISLHSTPSLYHDDVIKWKHFPCYWLFVRGIQRSPVTSSHKGQWRGALMFSLTCAWIHDWVNNREAGDLRRHCAHYDVTVMWSSVQSHSPIGSSILT